MFVPYEENAIKIFENSEFGTVRTVTIDNVPYFVGKDVCDVFGATNYRRLLSDLDDDEKGVSQMNTPGGNQNMSIINESGLYSLILCSKLPTAKKYKNIPLFNFA